MDQSNRIWFLMARSLSGEITPAEEAELRLLLEREDSGTKQQFDLLTRMWEDHNEEVEQKMDAETAKEAVSKIVKRSEGHDPIYEALFERPAKRRRIRRRIFLSFATFCLIVLSVFIYRSNNQPSQPAAVLKTDSHAKLIAKVIATDNGSRTRTLLKDGSTIWLNSDSKLLYENNFEGNTREVRLVGEAYFDIVKQANRPFIVHTAGIDIRVLGTAFNVKSYPEDKAVETTLFRGLVQVSKQNDTIHKPILLKPNEKLLLNKYAYKKENENAVLQKAETADENYEIKKIDSSVKQQDLVETAWKYDRLEFKGESFEEVGHKLERWYNIEVVFDDEKARQLRLTGSFENETPAQAFTALQTAFPGKFNFKIENNEIHIKSFE